MVSSPGLRIVPANEASWDDVAVVVEPRASSPHWPARAWCGAGHEDKSADDVWAITCFVVRAGHRRSGLMYALAEAARDHAFAHGARAVEGYPMVTVPGQDVTWGELHVGSRKVFAAAGFVEVTRPSVRRAVMRIDR
ncbi:MAG TPA: GNAT family N-acetyltransferase [Acidimicrobiales bacterium]